MRYATRAAAVVGVVAASSGSIVGEAFLAAPSLQAIHGRSTDKNAKLTFASSAAPTAALPRRRRKHALVGCAAMAMEVRVSPLTPRSPPATGAARKGVSGLGHRRPRPTANAPCLAAAAADEGDGGVFGPLRPLSPTEDGVDALNANPLDRNDPERARVSTLVGLLSAVVSRLPRSLGSRARVCFALLFPLLLW